MQFSAYKERLIIAMVTGLVCIVYYLVFVPIFHTGDSAVYIRYAMIITEGGSSEAFLSRSPLFSYLLSLFISGAGYENVANIAVALNFAFLFITLNLLYDIVSQRLSLPCIRWLAVALVLFSPSVIYFGYLVLTEMLSLMMMMITFWLILKRDADSRQMLFSVAAGVAFSLLVLARFNTLPLLAVIILIFLLERSYDASLKTMTHTLGIIICLLPVLFILGGYAFTNHARYGFYGLFPTGGSILVSRNAIIATIDGSELVSKEHQPLLTIFTSAGERFREERSDLNMKGSMRGLDRWSLSEKLYSGFPIYLSARNDLCSYFGIDRTAPEPYLSQYLRPFYREIIRENRMKLMELRFISLLSSFRSSTGLNSGAEQPVNLDKLPAIVIKMHKLLTFGLKITVTIAAVLWSVMVFAGRWTYDRLFMTFSLIWLGFLFTNFSLALVSDSNRYTFPMEPMTLVAVTIIAARLTGLYNTNGIPTDGM